MKKTYFSILALSLSLAILTACGAQAKQPDKPEPAPQAAQTELAQPVQLSEPEKTEISQEELEAIFESVYTTASENHPEDWNVDFQITDEIGKINSAIPDDKEAPSNLRSLYTDWRAAKVDTTPTTTEEEPAPVADYGFTAVDETLYATGNVNLRSGPGTAYDKVGSLSAGASVHRVGIGTGTADGWSQIQLSDGTLVCVSSNYLSYNKPVAQQAPTTPSGGGTQNNNQGSNQGSSQMTQSELDKKLAELGLVSGPSNYVDPKAGLTEEEIQQILEDAQKTEFRINGT